MCQLGREGRCVGFWFMVFEKEMRHAGCQEFFTKLQLQDDDEVGGIFDLWAREQMLVLGKDF